MSAGASFAEQVNRTPVTFLVLLAYVALGMVTGVFEVDLRKLMELGAAPAMAVQHEPWRLLAYAFLHGGMIHLLLNSYFLFTLGPMLEQALGSWRFALLYVVSAVGGGIGGNLWHDPVTPLVGGSGALFGIMGAGLALNMRQGRHLLDFLNYFGPRQLLLLIVANLVLGLVIPMVSNAGHVGGLIAGFALTFCFLARRRDPVDRLGRLIQMGWAALFASLLFWCTHPVTRWDYLLERFQRAPTRHEKAVYARATLRSAGGTAAMFGHLAFLDFGDTPPEEIWADLVQSARGG